MYQIDQALTEFRRQHLEAAREATEMFGEAIWPISRTAPDDRSLSVSRRGHGATRGDCCMALMNLSKDELAALLGLMEQFMAHKPRRL